MKKISKLLLAVIMMFCFTLSTNALTNYKYGDFIDKYGDAEAGIIEQSKTNPNITNLKGTDAEVPYDAMKTGPYIASNAKLSNGIDEVLYIDHSTLKQSPELFQISYQLFKDGKYAKEIDTHAQVGYDGKTVKINLSDNTEIATVPANGIYKYEFKTYVEDNVIYAEFNLYDTNDALLGKSGKINLNERFKTGETINDLQPTDNITLNAIWFCNIKVEDGINVYSLADKATVDTTDTAEKEETLENVLNESLSTLWDGYSDHKFEDLTVGVEIKADEVKKDDIDEIEKAVEKLPEAKEGLKLSNYFDISIAIRDSVSNVLIDNLTELSKPIELKVEIPTTIKAVKKGYTRKYYIVRNHNGEITLLPTNVSKDGKSLTFETDKFSIYAIAYLDTKNEDTSINQTTNTVNKINPENPQTFDGIGSYIAIGVISILALSGIYFYFKKELENK